MLLILLEDYKLLSSSQFGFPLPFTSSVVRVYVLCMPLLVCQKTALVMVRVSYFLFINLAVVFMGVSYDI